MLLRFLISLQEDGRAELVPPGRDLVAEVRMAGQNAEENRQVDQLLCGWHRDALLELAGPPLPYHGEGAKWGALRLFRAACFLSFREIEKEEIFNGLPGLPLPDSDLPEAHFSADLALRHWADLFRMTRALSPADPLVESMRTMVSLLPLACPGVLKRLPEDSPVFNHRGLCQLLAERAFACRDRELLADPRLNGLVRAKLGSYADELSLGILPPLEVES